MKKCIYQSKGVYANIKCKYTGQERNKCDMKRCNLFYPTLRYRFSEWWKEWR